MYVIMCKGKYLKSGSGHHNVWTNDGLNAAKFATIEEAKKNACDNEQIVRIE